MVMFIYYLDFQTVFSLQLFKNVEVSFQQQTFLNEDNFDFFFKYVGTDYNIGKGR